VAVPLIDRDGKIPHWYMTNTDIEEAEDGGTGIDENPRGAGYTSSRAVDDGRTPLPRSLMNKTSLLPP